MSEAEIIEGCKIFSPKAQKALYDLYARPMMGLCVRYMKSKPEAEDVFQEAFVKVFKYIGRVEHSQALGFWIRRIFVNTALNHLSRNKKNEKTVDVAVSEAECTELNPTDHDLNAKQLLEMVNKLPQMYRIVFNLYVIEGYSHKEISQMLGIQEGTSKSQLSRAKEMIRKMLLKTEIV